MIGAKQERARIRVLIVDDNRDTQDNLAKMLSFEHDVELVGVAASGGEGIEKARSLLPDVVLMDVNLPDVDGIRATESIRQRVPGTQVVMMSVQGEPDYLRQAMVAGASDYLVKPFSGDELATSIRRAHGRSSQRPPVGTPEPAKPQAVAASERGALVVVYSPKGGVGRTTIAVNLAVALRQETALRVALLDASLLFGDVGVALNLTADRTIVDLLPHLDELDKQVLDKLLLTHSSGVRVLLAPPRPELAELVTAEHMRKLLDHLQQSFDFVVVDTAPSLQEVTLTLLDNADQILVLTTLEMPSLKNVKLFLDTAQALDYPPERMLLVVNRADSAGGIRAQDVEDRVKHKVVAQVANDWKAATLATNRGAPFVLSQRDSPIARDMFDLARVVAGRSAGAALAAGAREGASRPREARR